MADVHEVRPDAVNPEVLIALERVFDGPRGSDGATLLGPDGEAVELPAGIQTLLVSVVESLKAGNGVAVVPIHAELTTVEAAQLLNVSRPHLIKQIEAGVILTTWSGPTGGFAWPMSSPTATKPMPGPPQPSTT